MMVGSQARKQRLFRFNAPLHVRQNFAHAHIDKAARQKLGIKKKSTQVHRGDTVKVMAGENKGRSGKVMAVNLRTSKLTINGIMKKNARGKEHGIPISINNVYITELNLEDKLRMKRLAPMQKASAAASAPSAAKPAHETTK
jgi:large subunit ribosomal protein L24